MPYFLWKDVIAITPKVPIEREEHDAILHAWRALAIVAEIEDEWECLIQNYAELEMEMLRSAMHRMVFSQQSRDEMHDSRLNFTRRLSSLLHSCRAYLYHTPHLLDSISSTAFSKPFKVFTNEAYDSVFSYRFMEALRNFAQHYGLPIHGTTFDNSWTIEIHDGVKRKGVQRHVVTAHVNIDRLRADKEFKRSILSHLAPEVERVDVATATREYMEALGGVHGKLRECMAEATRDWKQTVRQAIKRYADIHDGNAIALCVGEFAEDEPISKTHIFDDMISRIERMMMRNANLTNLPKRYVTNELPTAKGG